MKVIVKRRDDAMPVAIETEYIKLESALKLANLVMSGGEAKNLILDGQAKVNGEVCTMRGKKLRDGDTVEFMGQKIRIVGHAAE